MLRVHLKRDFFAPNHHRYAKSESRYDLRPIPDEFLRYPDGKGGFSNVLPSDATIVAEDNDPATEPLQTKNVLREKFEEAERAREQGDQELFNALAVAKAQSGPRIDPAKVPFEPNPARTEVRDAAEKQNRAQVGADKPEGEGTEGEGTEGDDPDDGGELLAAVARAKKNKK